ncbi:TRM11 family SAM-dependent methyltransferase [Paenibacillus sp. SYP-B4298]|uniref:TRM11 family SAM-dependent methyltransferase n=1 Tax=Paenibacillus sp. SYP-B4298 TaxID=2996034 RepID=UPI0022DD6124|nr:RNA methyltransferase [Paenibacillus sp. SYP-B4298]
MSTEQWNGVGNSREASEQVTKMEAGQPVSLYTYVCHESEQELCALELRELLGVQGKVQGGSVESAVRIAPDRSPFLKQRLDVLLCADTLDELREQATGLAPVELPFKVICLKTNDGPDYEGRLSVERLLGAAIRGVSSMREPRVRLGAARHAGRWVLGSLHEADASWLRHQDKPRQYSTALNVRMARAAVNIAIPRPEGIAAVDPCCGIGTVLLEALSMGVRIDGFDLNPLAVRGARENLAHFGYAGSIGIADMRSLQGHYDTAIIDFPYNHCSRLSREQLLEMMLAARRLADRSLFISAATQPVAALLDAAGFRLLGECMVSKGRFARHLLLCD